MVVGALSERGGALSESVKDSAYLSFKFLACKTGVLAQTLRSALVLENKGVLSTGVQGMLDGNPVNIGLPMSTISSLLPCFLPVIQQVNNDRMGVSPLSRGLGNVHGFVLNGRSFRPRLATAKNQIKSPVPLGRMKTPTSCNLKTIAGVRWSLITH